MSSEQHRMDYLCSMYSVLSSCWIFSCCLYLFHYSFIYYVHYVKLLTFFILNCLLKACKQMQCLSLTPVASIASNWLTWISNNSNHIAIHNKTHFITLYASRPILFKHIHIGKFPLSHFVDNCFQFHAHNATLKCLVVKLCLESSPDLLSLLTEKLTEVWKEKR